MRSTVRSHKRLLSNLDTAGYPSGKDSLQQTYTRQHNSFVCYGNGVEGCGTCYGGAEQEAYLASSLQDLFAGSSQRHHQPYLSVVDQPSLH